METFHAGDLIRSLNSMAGAASMFGDMSRQNMGTTISRQNYAELKERVEAIVPELERLNCNVTLQSARTLVAILNNEVALDDSIHPVLHDGTATWTALGSGRMFHYLNETRTRAADELGSVQCFYLTEADRSFYEPRAPLFGDAVDRSFSSSSEEIAEAGKCRALGRWTACVMHLMRALEPALKALQDAVGVDVPKEQWDQIINQIEAKIRQITKATNGKADEQWFSEAASQFRFIKNAWRNHAQHLNDHYDQERAIAIYDNVRAFMRHLATRLSE